MKTSKFFGSQVPRLAGLALVAALLFLTKPSGAAAGPPVALRQQEGGKTRPVPGGPLGADEKLASVGVVLLPEGFAPSELTVPAGATLLSIKKRVGDSAVNLELRAEGRERVIWHSGMSEKVHKWSEVIRLPPGEYSLSVAGRPDWKCRITAEPRGRS